MVLTKDKEEIRNASKWFKDYLMEIIIKSGSGSLEEKLDYLNSEVREASIKFILFECDEKEYLDMRKLLRCQTNLIINKKD